LGVRHAARPYTTVLTFANITTLPFDVAALRAIPYQLDQGRLTDNAAATLRASIKQAVEAALAANQADSPLFQLISDYPGVLLPHDSTEAFRDRARKVASLHDRLAQLGRATDKPAAVDEVRLIEQSLDSPHAETELMVDVLLTYRDLEAYDDMIRCVGTLPDAIRDSVTIQEQLGFALNRNGDRRGAIEVLRRLIDKHGASPETNGLLGRVYKDLYREARERDDEIMSEVNLDEAIDVYIAGFEADPRDHYPGVNAVTLLLQKGTDDALERARQLASVVSFSVSRRGGLASSDYWDLATVLELAAVGLDGATVARAAAKATQTGAKDWMFTTTIDNLALIGERYGEQAEPWLSEARERLEAARASAPSD
jgi:tetratricopeptide (TPR) repeat protein